METTIVGDVTSINHGNSLDFACKENRTLSESKDPDGDGLFNVVCYNGVLERQYLWPESNEVNTIFVHRYIRPKRAFNNYVDKMRGGGVQKMSVFVHAQGIKTVHAGKLGVKNGKILST